MSYYIAKFHKNIDDKFDVEGLSLMTKDEYLATINCIHEMDKYYETFCIGEEEFYFGTNEYFTFGADEKVSDAVSFTEITESTYYNMMEIFSGETFGYTIERVIEEFKDNKSDEMCCPECGNPLSEDEILGCYCDNCGAIEIDPHLSQFVDSLIIPRIF